MDQGAFVLGDGTAPLPYKHSGGAIGADVGLGTVPFATTAGTSEIKSVIFRASVGTADTFIG